MHEPAHCTTVEDVTRNARAEAQAVVGEELEAWVLEPSPPAMTEGPWFADDPVLTTRAAVQWDVWLGEHPERAEWAADRWLGAYRRLPAPPPGFAATRDALHRLAVYVVSPARRRVNTKIALRWALGGFGTPFFGDDEQVRVAGTHLVRQRGGSAAAEPITSLTSAAAFVLDGEPDVAWAEPFDVPPPDDDLGVDPRSASFLGDWYGFGASVLEELRAEPGAAEPSRVQLWPEHFDLAFDLTFPGGGRATFGASPGDPHEPQPYIYVLPPGASERPVDDDWNATAFHGAVLPVDGFLGAPDQRAAVLGFLRARRDLIA